MLDFRKAYFDWKESNGYIQADIAALVGVPRGTIASFEAGRSPLPHGETLLKMLEILYPKYYEQGLRGDYKCRKCGEDVPGAAQGATHCCRCGDRFGVSCKGCETVSPTSVKFCAQCGESLT